MEIIKQNYKNSGRYINMLKVYDEDVTCKYIDNYLEKNKDTDILIILEFLHLYESDLIYNEVNKLTWVELKNTNNSLMLSLCSMAIVEHFVYEFLNNDYPLTYNWIMIIDNYYNLGNNSINTILENNLLYKSIRNVITDNPIFIGKLNTFIEQVIEDRKMYLIFHLNIIKNYHILLYSNILDNPINRMYYESYVIIKKLSVGEILIRRVGLGTIFSVLSIGFISYAIYNGRF